MRESIVFLFYLLAPYISTSREKGHTETRAKDTKLLNTLRLHRLRLLLKFRKLATLIGGIFPLKMCIFRNMWAKCMKLFMNNTHTSNKMFQVHR